MHNQTACKTVGMDNEDPSVRVHRLKREWTRPERRKKRMRRAGRHAQLYARKGQMRINEKEIAYDKTRTNTRTNLSRRIELAGRVDVSQLLLPDT
jgi:hypothetical protein